MTVATRKQREFEARERLILDHAGELLARHGYLGLNLDELAERIEYAKGTIYLHFQNKEDLLLGVVVRLSQERARLFRHGARYPGLTRERCAAMGIADLLIKEKRPQAFQLIQLVTTASVWDKTSEKRREELRRSGFDMMEPGISLVREAMLNGDITRKDLSPEKIVLGLFAMSKGAMLIQANPEGFPPGWTEFVNSSIQEVRHAFCDGVGWKPFTSDHDYPTVERSMREEYFRDAFEEP